MLQSRSLRSHTQLLLVSLPCSAHFNCSFHSQATLTVSLSLFTFYFSPWRPSFEWIMGTGSYLSFITSRGLPTLIVRMSSQIICILCQTGVVLIWWSSSLKYKLGWPPMQIKYWSLGAQSENRVNNRVSNIDNRGWRGCEMWNARWELEMRCDENVSEHESETWVKMNTKIEMNQKMMLWSMRGITCGRHHLPIETLLPLIRT